MSTVYTNKGKSIKAGAAATPTTVVPGLLDFDIGEGSRELFDTTNHATTGTKTYQPEPLREPRSIEVKLQFDSKDTEHGRLYAAYLNGTLEYQTFILPSGSTFAFSGYITDFPIPGGGLTGQAEASYTFRAVAAETFTASPA